VWRSSPAPACWLRRRTRVASGRITDGATGEPLEGSRILVVGTGLIEASNREGGYGFRSVAPGQYQIRVLRIGYESKIQPVTVAPDETAVSDFALTSVALTLAARGRPQDRHWPPRGV
jgi:carboxypeptidase family protein